MDLKKLHQESVQALQVVRSQLYVGQQEEGKLLQQIATIEHLIREEAADGNGRGLGSDGCHDNSGDSR